MSISKVVVAILSGALSLTLTVMPAAAAPQKPAELLRVLTLNFNAETTPQDVHGHLREARFKALVDWVRKNDPDVILLQEGWNFRDDPSVALTLARALGWDMTYRLDMGAPGFMYDSVAVLAKKKYRMSDKRELCLPHNAPHWGDGKSWIVVTGAVSYGVGATLHLASGEPVYVYTSHLVGSTANDKRDQYRALSEFVRAQVEHDGGKWGQAKVILGGDLNSPPGSPLDQYAQTSGYRDAWELTHPNDPGFTDCSDPSNPCFNPLQLGGDLFPSQNGENASVRIDHLYSMGRDFETLASTLTFTAPFEGVWMSDHYALLTTYGADGEMPTNVPNPARDNEQFMLPTTMFNISSRMFYCGGPSIDHPCERELKPFYVIGPRGLTIKDVRGCGFLEIRFKGPGDIYSSPHASLDNNERASFVFTKDGDYEYTIIDADKNILYGVVHVVVEPFLR